MWIVRVTSVMTPVTYGCGFFISTYRETRFLGRNDLAHEPPIDIVSTKTSVYIDSRLLRTRHVHRLDTHHDVKLMYKP